MKRGFTALEALISVAIIGVAVTIVALSFPKLESSQALDKSSSLVASVLDEARSKTLSGIGDSQYGVEIEASDVVLFKGSSYSPSDPENVSSPLSSLVGIKNIFLNGGGSSVVFDRLTGATSAYGTLDLYLKSSATTTKRITISQTGIIEEN